MPSLVRALSMFVIAVFVGTMAVFITPQTAVAAGVSPVWQLPFESGQSWQAGAPHASFGSTKRGSVDFGPSSGAANDRVVAVARGTVYKVTCGSKFYLGIDHGNGWKSTYYHLTDEQVGLVGKTVETGTYLGRAGTTTPCGGGASFKHVHLTILKDNVIVDLNGVKFAGYTVHSSGRDYHGTWTNTAGTTVVRANGGAACCLVSTTKLGEVSEGSFVLHGGHIYRIAGGAPIYVSTWSAFGGAQPYRELSAQQFSALRRVPADGTVIAASGTGEVYVVAGGAPIYVSTWDALGGPQPPIVVDRASIARAGEADQWSHLSVYPADGTFIYGHATGRVYRVAGGSPQYVSTWAAVGGSGPATKVDERAITNASGAAPWNHLRTYPLDGTVIVGHASGDVYRIVGGAPLYVSSWASIGGGQPFTRIDQAAITNVDGSGTWTHLRKFPANGAVVVDTNGTAYVFAGGAPLALDRPSDAGGGAATPIDVAVITNTGLTTEPWNHTRALPVDGTFISTAEGKVFRTAGGAPMRIVAWSDVGGAKPTVVVSNNTVAKAGGSGAWRFLRKVAAEGTVVQALPSKRYFQVRAGYWFSHTAVASAIRVSDLISLPSAVSAVQPKIVGTREVGKVLTVENGVWKPSPITLKHQWYRNGAAIPGATGLSYTLTTADAGTTITVRASGSRTGLTTTSSTSAGSLILRRLTTAPTPKVTGTARVGRTLSVTTGTWVPAPINLKYQWLRNGKAISGATASTYALTSTDVGSTISVTVTGSKTGFVSVSKTSVATAAVAK